MAGGYDSFLRARVDDFDFAFTNNTPGKGYRSPDFQRFASNQRRRAIGKVTLEILQQPIVLRVQIYQRRRACAFLNENQPVVFCNATGVGSQYE
jgi:hypothetical protein